MLASPESALGILVILRGASASHFDAAQLELASAFAEQTALAVRLAEDRRALNELAVLSDRDRIVRDLHDHVIQQLFAHGLSLHGVHQRARSPELQRQLAAMIDDVHDVVGEIRSAIFHLHVGGPEGSTQLRRRLHQAIDGLTADSGLQTTVRMNGPIGVVSAQLAEHAEAVVREALSNAVRHAQASSVTVTVTAEDELVIEVVDDGSGIPESVVTSGLRNLHERAVTANGEFAVRWYGADLVGAVRLI